MEGPAAALVEDAGAAFVGGISEKREGDGAMKERYWSKTYRPSSVQPSGHKMAYVRHAPALLALPYHRARLPLQALPAMLEEAVPQS